MGGGDVVLVGEFGEEGVVMASDALALRVVEDAAQLPVELG